MLSFNIISKMLKAETITTKIVVCVTGELIKTDIFISETITRGESCEE